jgi:hypothetical protein
MVISPLINRMLIGASIWSKRAVGSSVCRLGSSVMLNDEAIFSVQASTLYLYPKLWFDIHLGSGRCELPGLTAAQNYQR